LIGLTGVTLALYAWRLPPFQTTVQTTNDAYVRGRVTIIAPQLAGYIAEVPVQDYQRVKAGDLLVKIDDRIFAQKLEQARATLAGQNAALANSEQQRLSDEAQIASGEAQVESAKANADTAATSYARVQPLAKNGFVTQSDADAARNALDQANGTLSQARSAVEVARQNLAATIVSRQSLEAAVTGAEAAVHLAEIDLDNTRILAPKDGTLGEVGARIGQYVSAGTQLTSVVPAAVWVVANFKETQLAGMEIGQPVSFTVDALSHATLTGRVQRFSPATGSEFSVLKADNATGNFTKVAQRVPVMVAVDPGQALAARLAPGMSVVVSLDTASVPDVVAAAN
jgi:multidrug resistance efflux pump